MRKNTWVFYFFITVFTTILSINLVWHFTPVKEEISAALQDRLKPYLGDTFAMSDFTLGFGYMSFYNISAGSSNENYLLELDEIQIGFSIHKLPFNNLDPLRVIESITIKKPRLIVLTAENDSIVQNNNDSLDVTIILTELQRLAEVDRVLINKGQILWGDDYANLTKLVSDLDGYLIVYPEEKVNLNLKGKLFESTSRDISLIGKVNLSKKSWDIDADIEKSHLKESIPFLNSKSFSLKTADIQGKLHISCPSYRIYQVSLDGKIHVSNMIAHIFDQKLFTDAFDIIFNKQRMILSPVSGGVEDGRFTLNGNLGSVFHPNPHFNVNFNKYSAKDIAISAPILELLNQGKIRGNIKINGPVSEIEIKGKIYSSNLYYSIAPFQHVNLDFTYKKGLWNFHNIKTYSVGMNHQGTGEIDFNDMKLKLAIHSHHQIKEQDIPILDKLNNTNMTYRTTVDGDFHTQTFTGNIKNIFYQGVDTLWINDFKYELIKDQISIQSTDTSSESMKLHAEISDLWNNPTFTIMDINNIPFNIISQIEALQWIDKYYHINLYFSGPVNFPTTKINFKSRKSDEVVFSFVGNLINLIKSGFKFKGYFTLQTRPQQIRGNFTFEDKNNQFDLNLNVPSMIDGNLVIGIGEYGSFNGKFTIEKFPVVNYIAQFPKTNTAIQEGDIHGNILVGGTVIDPKINFNIQGDNFIINDNGYYTAKLKGVYQKTGLKIEDSKIYYNNHPIIDANVNLDMVTNDLSATFHGDGIESNFIASTIFKDLHLVKGDLNYQVHIKGSYDQPNIFGTLTMKDGMVKGRNFSNLHIEFEDSIPQSGSLFQINKHIFKIRKFTYEDQRNFVINVSGLFPVESGAPLSLNLNAQGNILAELPNIVDYFQNPSCLGNLTLFIGGTRENPKINAGQIKIYNGSLNFRSVIPPLKNLKVEMELQEGTDFIHVKNLQGEINNRPTKLYNTPEAVVNGDTLKPWYFDEIGLNFGIIVLETDEKGIPLSIPGLMNPGDIGFFATKGKQEGEKLYFAGPPEIPYLRGQITLIESRVTFPFLEVPGETESQEDDKVTEFLMNINWDVKAIAGVGNRYFIDIPAMLGQVYLDLNIDNVSEGLEFTGSLNDESFKVEGSIESTRGQVEYLDMNFRVDRFGVIFNKFELYPEVYGRAWTTVRDSTDFPRDIYLTLYTVNPETGQEVNRGRWEYLRFKLVSSDPTIGETQQGVLAYLGYSVDNIPNKAGDIGASLTENFLIRPLIRPIERKMERGLGLDYVRLSLQITSTLFYYGFQSRWKYLPEQSYIGQNLNNRFNPSLMLLQSSEITLGKYLVQNLYFTYSGQLVSVYDEAKLGLNHRLGLEYRILQNLLLEFEFDKLFFDSKYYGGYPTHDFRIRLKQSFNF